MENETNPIPGIGDQPETEPLYGYSNREVHIFYDKDKGFIQKVTCHNNITQVLIKAELDLNEDDLAKVRERVRDGSISPLAYHMHRCLMDPSMLADYSGLPVRKVKKHLKPSGYSKMDEATKKKYAGVFQISTDDLDKIEPQGQTKGDS